MSSFFSILLRLSNFVKKLIFCYALQIHFEARLKMVHALNDRLSSGRWTDCFLETGSGVASCGSRSKVDLRGIVFRLATRLVAFYNIVLLPSTANPKKVAYASLIDPKVVVVLPLRQDSYINGIWAKHKIVSHKQCSEPQKLHWDYIFANGLVNSLHASKHRTLKPSRKL